MVTTLGVFRLNVIIPFWGTLINFVLGIFVLSRDSKNEVNRSFCYLSGALALLNFKVLLLQLAPSYDLALDWIKIFHIGNVFTFSTFFHFALAIINDKTALNRRFLYLAYFLSTVLLFANWANFPAPVIMGVRKVYESYSPIINKGYNLVFLCAYCFFFAYGLFLLIKKYYFPIDALEKNRIGLVLVAAATGFITGIPNFFLTGQIANMYPTGYLGSIFACLISSFAIVKYQLMDVEIALRSSTIYTLVTAAVTGCFLSSLYIFQASFENATGSNSKLPTVLAIWLVSFLFQPIRVSIQRLADRFFYQQRIDYQEILSEFSGLIVTTMSREKLAHSAVTVLEEAFGAKSASILLLHQNGHKQNYQIEAVAGIDRLTSETVVFEENDTFIEYLKDHKSWILKDALRPHFHADAGPRELAVVEAMEKIKASVVFPLFWGHNKMVGLLSLGSKRSTDIYNAEEIKLLTILSNEAAVAFENANLFDDARRHLTSAIEALAAVVEAKDSYTFGHCHRVINHAVAIGRKLNLPPDKIEALRLGAALHDIGKIGISKAILGKPGKLTEQEFAVICTHPEIGAGILRPLNLSRDVLDAVKYHHEQFDGSGYPCKLKGEQIPLIARIISIADVYEALTSDRVYRKGMSKEEALRILRVQNLTHFDPKLLEIFFLLVN